MVRMVNEYGSAYKTVHYREDVEELLAAGWKIAEETVATPAPAPIPEPIKVVDTHAEMRNKLIYKGKYLSQWLQIATKEQLREIFDYFGIVYSSNTKKSDMQIILRKYIREKKAEMRSEQNDGK